MNLLKCKGSQYVLGAFNSMRGPAIPYIKHKDGGAKWIYTSGAVD